MLSVVVIHCVVFVLYYNIVNLYYLLWISHLFIFVLLFFSLDFLSCVCGKTGQRATPLAATCLNLPLFFSCVMHVPSPYLNCVYCYHDAHFELPLQRMPQRSASLSLSEHNH